MGNTSKNVPQQQEEENVPPPKQSQANEVTKPKVEPPKKESWFGSLFGGKNRPKKMILPDDKNPTVSRRSFFGF
jgi:hypothetical protein